jgi:hypothetical protein
MGSITTAKPKVVSITYPSWAGKDYMTEFEKNFDLHVSAQMALRGAQDS